MDKDPVKKKTPTPRVLAALLVIDYLKGTRGASAQDMGELLVPTKVSDAKRMKVLDQLEKLCHTFEVRMHKIVNKFLAK